MLGDMNFHLYEDVRDAICKKIYTGEFKENDRIPAERSLSELLNVSRITVRKSLDILVEQGLIVKEPGSGNRVILPNKANAGSMDMIVLIASASNPFFSEFIKTFQEYGKEYGSMVMYAEKPKNESLVDSIYRFYEKGLQNVVIWPEDAKVDIGRLRRLRALGMNMVFFDTDVGLPYADAVVLDNRRAIEEIFKCLQSFGLRDVGYVGWSDGPEYSCKLREKYALEHEECRIFLKVPWKDRKNVRSYIYRYVLKNISKLPPALFYADAELGLALAASLRELEYKGIILAGVDDFQDYKSFNTIAYRQDIEGAVKNILKCVEQQSSGEASWQAVRHYIRGRIV